MRLGGFLFSVSAIAGVLIAVQGCSILGADTDTKEDRLCTPGDYVFCRCADRAEGTKLCKADGKSFESCTTSETGECVGGEIDDPRTNEPIPKDKDPDPNNNPPDKPNALQSCPGKSQAVQPGLDIKLEGDTTTATSDRKGKAGGACAVGAGADDHVYRLIPSGSGSLEVKVQGSNGLDPVAYVRTTCDDEASQASCAPPSPNKLAQLKLNVVTGREYFLVIDGASSSAGKYVANLKLTTGSFCGDGKVDQNEACDDGNKTEDDGCSNDCRKVNGNPTSGASCPGQPVDVWAGQTVTGSGSTTAPGYGNAWNAPSSSACSVDIDGTNSFPDHVYAVTPHANGNLVVNVTAPPTGALPNLMIAARRTCTAVGTDPALCANDASIGGTETLTIPVTNNEKVYVAIDGGGASSNQGGYTVSFKLQ
jgi:cysteine-rich repeat protein